MLRLALSDHRRGDTMNIVITREIAARCLYVVDHGLSSGMGDPVLGGFCVEAAICYALGLPHGDDPGCVSPALRSLKISLNDRSWSSNGARAKGLRRLALAQLGSAGVLDEQEFARRVAEMAIRKMVPIGLRAAASIQKDAQHRQSLLDAARRCEGEDTRDAAIVDAIVDTIVDASFDTVAHAATHAARASASARAATYAAAYSTTSTVETSVEAAVDAANSAVSAVTHAAAADADAALIATYAATRVVNVAVDAAFDAAEDAASATTYTIVTVTTAVDAADAAADTDAYVRAAADSSYAAARQSRDKVLSDFAEAVVQILIEMQAPGCKWLDLAEAA